MLLSSGNLTGARDFARDARRHGVHAGLLRSREYPSLAPGFWLVFSGVYKTRAQAQRASARLKHRYSGAYPQFVDGAKRKP